MLVTTSLLARPTRTYVLTQKRGLFGIDKMKQRFEEIKAKGAVPKQGPTSMKQAIPGVKHIVAVSSAKVGAFHSFLKSKGWCRKVHLCCEFGIIPEFCWFEGMNRL
jgi:hypothetical protein